MKVAGGAVVNKEARVVRDVETRVESGKKRVIQRSENLGFRLDLQQLLVTECVLINDLEGETGMIVVSQMAEEDAAEVAGAEVADEFQVAEVEMAVG